MDREGIKRIISVHNIPQRKIADAVGLPEQVLSYQLNHAKRFDEELTKSISNYFNKIGIHHSEGEVVMLNSLFLGLTSITTQCISVLTNEVKQSLTDDKIDDQERARLKNRISDMRENVNDALDKMEELIK